MQDKLLEELRSVPLWQGYQPTPLIELPLLARHARIERLFVKVEGARPLGNFKVLGGLLAGLRALARAVGAASINEVMTGRYAQALPRLVCASDGNHGLAVAAAARSSGTTASIFLPQGVSHERSARIEEFGGTVIRVEGTYDHAVQRAAEAAARGDGLLIPDTTSDPLDPVVRDVLDGYALLSRELVQQFASIGDRASHVFVQAGVGGLAASLALGLRDQLRAPGRIVVVEPESAACVSRALDARQPVLVEGSLGTVAEMLSCGLASAPALEILLRHRAVSVQVTDDALRAAAEALRRMGGPQSTPSGAAGLAGLLTVSQDSAWRSEHALTQQGTVLLIATESVATDAHPATN